MNVNYANPETALMRIQIARDALEQLNAQKLRPCRGKYCQGLIRYDEVKPGAKHVDTLTENCEVCAKGALFLSKFRLHGIRSGLERNITRGLGDQSRYPPGTTYVATSNHEVVEELDEFFSRKQLSVIETYFEGWHNIGMAHMSARNILAMILENIIANDGEFIPEKTEWPRG